MKYVPILLITLTLISCRKKFEKDIWAKNKNQNSDNPRFDMVDDLRRNYLLKGKSSSNVFILLGNADYVDTTELGTHWTYSIGSNPGFHMDPYYLVVDFDSTGHLIETSIVEH